MARDFACPTCGNTDGRYGCRPGLCGAVARQAAGLLNEPVVIRSQPKSIAGATVGFIVRGAPVPLARARVFTDESGESGARTPKRSRAYKAKVKKAAQVARAFCSAWTNDARYALALRVCWSNAKRHDLSNVLKAIEDALIEVLFDDDSQIDSITVTGEIDRAKPRVEVEVRILEEGKRAA